MNLHATCISLYDKGLLITGPSGVGKSDLALRLLELGGTLVADDQVLLAVQHSQLIATCPPHIAGLIEARGVGLFKLPHLASVPVYGVIQPGTPERLPGPQFYSLLGHNLPTLTLPYCEASTPAKIRLWLQHEQHA